VKLYIVKCTNYLVNIYHVFKKQRMKMKLKIHLIFCAHIKNDFYWFLYFNFFFSDFLGLRLFQEAEPEGGSIFQFCITFICFFQEYLYYF